MRRRGKAGIQPAESRRRSTVTPKARKAPTGRVSTSDLQGQIDALTRELKEAREQQTGTFKVLQVISSSPGELEPVFRAILENATRICGAKFGVLWRRFDDGTARIFASLSVPSAFAEFLQRGPHRPGPFSPINRVAKTRQRVHIADFRVDQAYLTHDPLAVAGVELGGQRTLLVVPMLKEDKLVGMIAIYRQEVRPFTDKQIELVENFAAQAVIAIENARLLNELRQRTDDLSESLEQQTATSEVLKVISSSPGELEPVFETMLANAVRICGAKFGNLFLCEGDGLRAVAFHGAPQAYVEERRRNPVLHPNPATTLGRAMATKQPVQIADIQAYEPDTIDAASGTTGVKLAKLAGARTVLAVPMVKDSELVGAVVIYRQEVLPFTDKQIGLVQNFGAQAVIAVENTRLLNELRQRTGDLSEALEQQTATSEVLKVISSSPNDLRPVFHSMLENSVRICEAKFGQMFLCEGDNVRAVAHLDVPAALVQWDEQRGTFRPSAEGGLMRAIRTKNVIHIDDFMSEQPSNPVVKLGGARSYIAVPMLKENELVGVIVIYRQEVRPFTEKQIDLVRNFATQAVIAIENARLLNELRESLQQQTATADVLKVISRSTFDLQTVLDTLAKSAARLCDADQSFLNRREGENYVWAASYGFSQEAVEFRRSRPLLADRGTATGRAIVEGKIVHIPDVFEDTEYKNGEAQKLNRFRAVLGVPLLREGMPMGVFALTRFAPRPFTKKQIELVSTFADQAAIAIENVRLFESVEARTRELAKSLDDLRTTQDRLVQTQKLASLGQLTAGIAHEIKNPLNFVNNFSGVSAELIDELQEAFKDVSLNEKRRTEISELMDTLRGNLDKVVQHGKRADAIVKNMLLHSREGSGEHRVVDINTLVEESLNLAWHGARAEKQGFDITLERSFDPSAGEVDVFPQDITRALLNLISNGFYAAIQRKAETNGGDYAPTLAASTKSLGDRVEILIRDNGTGISPDVKEKMFNPFFTTKPTGEGTGLGLSISHDIIVKQHGGSIEVDTRLGEFTKIKVVLPRVAALLPDRS